LMYQYAENILIILLIKEYRRANFYYKVVMSEGGQCVLLTFCCWDRLSHEGITYMWGEM